MIEVQDNLQPIQHGTVSATLNQANKYLWCFFVGKRGKVLENIRWGSNRKLENESKKELKVKSVQRRRTRMNNKVSPEIF